MITAEQIRMAAINKIHLYNSAVEREKLLKQLEQEVEQKFAQMIEDFGRNLWRYGKHKPAAFRTYVSICDNPNTVKGHFEKLGFEVEILSNSFSITVRL